jgi:electron transfer flavoprotein alpha subunit
MAENVAAQVLAMAASYSHILFPATAGGKNVAPRVAAKLDVAQISDITKVLAAPTPSSAPSTRATPLPRCKALTPPRSSPCAPRALTPLPASGGSAAVETVAGVADSGKSSVHGQRDRQTTAPN